jgi:predicted dehydrogenase
MTRWGILSTAKIGSAHVIPALLAAQNCTVTAVASRTQDKAEKLAQQFAIPHVFTSYEALLESDEVDAVYIPLPTSHHVDWAIKAAEAGKHVLCEKPVALKADEIGRVIAARDANNVIVSEAFMVTYHPQWHKVRELSGEGAIGQIKRIEGAFTYYNTDPNNMRNIVELGGGALPDIGCYPIVAARFATDCEPTKVTAEVVKDATFGTDTFASSQIDFGAFQMSMYVSTQMALRQSMCFHGDKGYIEVQAPFNAGNYDDCVVTLYNVNHSEARVYRFTGVDQYQLQVEAFSRAVHSSDQRASLFSLENSQRNQRVIDAIYRAGETAQWENV